MNQTEAEIRKNSRVFIVMAAIIAMFVCVRGLWPGQYVRWSVCWIPSAIILAIGLYRPLSQSFQRPNPLGWVVFGFAFAVSFSSDVMFKREPIWMDSIVTGLITSGMMCFFVWMDRRDKKSRKSDAPPFEL